MKRIQINIRLNADDREKLSQYATEFGVDLSTAMRLIFKSWSEKNGEIRGTNSAFPSELAEQISQIKEQNDAILATSKSLYALEYATKNPNFSGEDAFRGRYSEGKEHIENIIKKAKNHV